MTLILFSFDLGIVKKMFLKSKIVDTTIIWYLVYKYNRIFFIKKIKGEGVNWNHYYLFLVHEYQGKVFNKKTFTCSRIKWHHRCHNNSLWIPRKKFKKKIIKTWQNKTLDNEHEL